MATLEKSELDIALERLTPQWLAGFFDGEGCISIVRPHGDIPSLVVNLVQCDLNTLTLIGLKYGAGREPYPSKRKSPKHSQKWVLQFAGRNALPFLEVIFPHVVLKRKLVGWAIEMALLHGERGPLEERPLRKGSGARATAPRIRQRREELMRLVKAENQSGKLTVQ